MSSFSFYPFFILHNITTQYMLSFSVQKLSGSLWPTQATVYQCQWKAHRVFFFFLFFFYVSFSFFSILPFKKYQFHKRYVEVFVCCFFVSVCVCLHVEKHLYSSVGKKGYVWNLSLPLFCPPPSFRWAWWSPGSGFCQLSEGLLSECKRRHRLLFSCRGMDTHFLWTCEHKNGVLFSSWIVFFFFLSLLFSCNNSLLVFFFFLRQGECESGNDVASPLSCFVFVL